MAAPTASSESCPALAGVPPQRAADVGPWWVGEAVVLFLEVANRKLLGRKMAVQSVYRLSTAGLPLGDGRRVRLRRLKTAGGFATTREEIVRFQRELTRARGGDL